MCLILIAWQVHPGFPRVVAANRDEFHDRPTAPAGWWQDNPHVLAGRDLKAGGTWMGISRDGRFAALTNFRDPAHARPGAPSRGPLVSDFLAGRESAEEYLARIARKDAGYNGYNLLLGTRTQLFWHSNVSGETRALAPGVYGLSNELLDSPWPKLVAAKSDLSRALGRLPDDGPLFRLLRDDRTYPDDALPRTGVSLDLERMLSAAFILDPRRRYGTRSSTVLLEDVDGRMVLDEQSWLPDGKAAGRRRFAFEVDQQLAP